MADTALKPRPVDTDGGDDDPNHVACPVLDRTWCGMDAGNMTPLPDPMPSLETFCRVCLLAIEMHGPDDPCPVCGTRECLSR